MHLHGLRMFDQRTRYVNSTVRAHIRISHVHLGGFLHADVQTAIDGHSRQHSIDATFEVREFVGVLGLRGSLQSRRAAASGLKLAAASRMH